MKEQTLSCPDCGNDAKILGRLLVGKPEQEFVCVRCDVRIYGESNIERWLKARREAVTT